MIPIQSCSENLIIKKNSSSAYYNSHIGMQQSPLKQLATFNNGIQQNARGMFTVEHQRSHRSII